jgi:hypothetical protein
MSRRILQHRVVRRSVVGVAAVAGLVLLGIGAFAAWLDWRFQAPAAAADVAQLRRELVTLRADHAALGRTLIDAQGRSDLLGDQPSGDVVIALPTAFVAGVVTDVVTGWFNEVDVHLRDIRLQKAGTVRARVGLLGRRTLGDYMVRLHLADVRGRLEPEIPVLTFGGDSIAVTLPVRLTGGEGRGRISFDWDARGLARPVCGDLAAEHAIEGTVVPQRYLARGRLHLAASAGGIIADPEFPGLSLRLRVRPSAASVQSLETLLASKGPLCDLATSAGNVEGRIMELVGRGFVVKIPQQFFRPVRLPISLEQELSLLDRSVGITVTPAAVRVTPQAVWLSANVAVHRAAR